MEFPEAAGHAGVDEGADFDRHRASFVHTEGGRQGAGAETRGGGGIRHPPGTAEK